MPTYYFDSHENGVTERDDSGVELPDLAAARRQAMQAIKEAVSDEVAEERLADVTTAYVEIRDGSGRVLLKLPYAEAVGLSWPVANPSIAQE